MQMEMPEHPASERADPEQPAEEASRRSAPLVGQGIYARRQRSLWQRYWRLLMAVVIVASAALATRVVGANVDLGNTLAVQIENQQPVTIDLRTSMPRSPYVFGVNVFPPASTQS